LQNLFKENEQDLTDYIGQMSLDESQKDSVNHALNSNFALIQGPPGTGKTYVGVQLVKILIKYK
jgi:superfamily II DNA or RNA helicase